MFAHRVDVTIKMFLLQKYPLINSEEKESLNFKVMVFQQ